MHWARQRNRDTSNQGLVTEQDSAIAQALPLETPASGEAPRSDGSATSSSAAERAELRQWFGGAAGAQQERGSEFIRKLNEGGRPYWVSITQSSLPNTMGFLLPTTPRSCVPAKVPRCETSPCRMVAKKTDQIT